MSNGPNASTRQVQMEADDHSAAPTVRDDTTFDYPAARIAVHLRVSAGVFLLAGLIGAIIWAVALRPAGSDGVVAGIIVGSIFVASLMVVMAYVMDLFTFVRRNESMRT
jgi:hypothetical protein